MTFSTVRSCIVHLFHLLSKKKKHNQTDDGNCETLVRTGTFVEKGRNVKPHLCHKRKSLMTGSDIFHSWNKFKICGRKRAVWFLGNL